MDAALILYLKARGVILEWSPVSVRWISPGGLNHYCIQMIVHLKHHRVSVRSTVSRSCFAMVGKCFMSPSPLSVGSHRRVVCL
jgi:hypothetical protein